MSEWATVTLADIADIRFSNVDKKFLAGEKSVRLCNYMDAYSNNYITADLPFMEATATAPEMERFKVEKGDNIITKDSETPDDIGIPTVVIDDIPNLICGYHLALIKPKRDKVDPIYLSKQLGSKQSAIYFSRLANGSTRYGLSSSAIASIKIPLAPFVEQRRIADILFTLDKAIEKTEALIAKYQQIKAGLMHDLFTRGITADGKLRPPREQAPELYRESPIGWIPKEWDTATTGDLCNSIVPGRNKPALDGGEFPWITITDLSGTKITESRAGLSVSATALRIATGRTVPAGSVIMSCVGSFGIVAIAGCELVINQQLHAFLTNERIHPEWLMHSLRLQESFMERIATQTTIKYINKAGCESIPIAIPRIEEQQRTVRLVEGIEKIGNFESQLALKLRLQKSGLMSDLLTVKVRVKPESKILEMAGG